MDLIKVENGALSLEEEAIQKLASYHEAKIKFDIAEQELKDALITAMENNGIKHYDNDFFTIDYVAEYTRQSVDTAKMKNEGIYDEYVKQSIVKPSVKISWK